MSAEDGWLRCLGRNAVLLVWSRPQTKKEFKNWQWSSSDSRHRYGKKKRQRVSTQEISLQSNGG